MRWLEGQSSLAYSQSNLLATLNTSFIRDSIDKTAPLHFLFPISLLSSIQH